MSTSHRIEMQLSPITSPLTWTTVTDVVRPAGIHAQRGSTTFTPIDRTAQPGTLTFALRNDGDNSGHKLGYYSPNHANCRAGFGYGTPVRYVVNDGSDHVLWTGKLRTIDPEPGTHRGRLTHCTAQDCVGEFAEATVREIDAQQDVTEVELIEAVLNALPIESQPPATDLDTALDVYLQAFDQIGAGAAALGLLNDTAVSAFGWIYPLGDGTLVYENRHSRALKSSSYTLNADTDGEGIEVPSSLNGVFNRIRTTIHEKTPMAGVVLYRSAAAIEVGPGQVITVWGTYADNDNNNTARFIGGRDFETPLVASTDYVGNTLEDGSGTDKTSTVSITATPFGSTVKFEIETSDAGTVWVSGLQLRGVGLYDNAPQTFESYIAKDYGDRPLEIDLKFQNQPSVAQDLADYVKVLVSQLGVPRSVTMKANRSSAVMTQALTREIGDLVTLSESVTGTTAVEVAIQGIAYELTDNGAVLLCTWYLSPQADAHPFVLNDPIYGVLDSPDGVLFYA